MKRNFWFYPLIMMGILLMITSSCEKDNEGPSNALKDIDGNVYTTVTIGTQVWMVENLKTTKYRDGSAIPNVTDSTEWYNLSKGAYCNYDNNPNNSITYGRLYNWYAVNDDRNIAPTGWHVPTDTEWNVLIDYLGGDDVAGGKLKQTGITHWYSPNTGATNESGFTALPGGFCMGFYISNQGGFFFNLSLTACFWSSTEFDSDLAYKRWLSYSGPHIHRSDFPSADKNTGMSVRCIRD